MADEFLHLLLIDMLNDAEEAHPRIYDHRRSPFDELSDAAFLKMFRLSKELCRFLITILGPYLTYQKRPTDLDVTSRVLIALRFYACGYYLLDVASNKFFCVSQPTVSRCITEVTDALNNPDVFNRFVKFPSTLEELNNIRLGYYQQYKFPGIMGIIDCTHIAIVTSSGPEHHELIYVNRKHYDFLNVQLICDKDLRILNYNAAFPGSTHDSYIWHSSNVYNALRRLRQSGHCSYYLLGDSGYPLRPWLISPLSNNPPRGTPEYRFNATFKTVWCSIERCNGVLKKRFRCLLRDRVLNYTAPTAGRIVNAYVVLHNLCIEHKIPQVIDNDFPANSDFGMYDYEGLSEEKLEANGEAAVRRVNPELF